MSLEMEVLSLGSKGPLNAVEPPVPTYAGNTGVTQGEGRRSRTTGRLGPLPQAPARVAGRGGLWSAGSACAGSALRRERSHRGSARASLCGGHARRCLTDAGAAVRENPGRSVDQVFRRAKGSIHQNRPSRKAP